MPERGLATPDAGVPGPMARAAPSRARWYLNRLRCMSAVEIAHRLRRAVTIRAERLALVGRSAPPAPDLTTRGARWLAGTLPPRVAPYLAAADRIVAGKLDVFTMRGVHVGTRPRWNRDPKTGVEAPVVFGKLLDYRDPRLVGDIRHLWEPNRHLHLVTLAQAYAASGRTCYFDTLRAHLESWLEACPYRFGPNWTSALEPAIRLVNWAVAWQLIGGSDSPAFETEAGARLRDRWLASVHEHASFVRGYFSLHSSANNHLIGEAAGVLVAAATWPHWRATERWLAEARAILEREILRQNAPDGVNREQAVAYARFELDLLMPALLAAEAAGAGFSAEVRARVERMLEFIASIMDVGGNVPAFGDSDDSCVVLLSQEPDFCPYRSLLATGAVLFERADFKVKARALDDKTQCLLGADAAARFDALDGSNARLPVRRAFPDGGYYILGRAFEQPAEIRLIADAGPLGYGAISAHGHADALAFTLSVGGREILVDPGTYTYRPDSPWRAYFRGTPAHNTLRVDALDQSEPGGTFMWLAKAGAGLDRFETSAARDVFEGWHDGYTRLRDPVLHRRRIVVDKTAGRIVVEDQIEAAAEHDLELLFHCSEHCRVDETENGYAIVNGDVRVHMRLPQAVESRSEVHEGQCGPALGWISRRFGERRPAPTIVWRARLARCVLTTELVVDGAA